MTRRMVLTALLLFAVIITAGLNTDLRAAEKTAAVRVMVLPFDGNSAGKFGYLTSAIQAMVSSRLSARKDVELVEYVVGAEDIRRLRDGAMTEGDSLFQQYNVDYVVSGALYALQTGLKIQAVVAGRDEAQGPAQLNVLAETEERILPQVEVLVADIAGRAMSLEAAEGTIPAGADRTTGLSGFTTEHPEKLYKKGLYKGAVISEGTEGVQVVSRGVKRSSKLPLMIVAMEVADLDGDGRQDIVSASRTGLLVSRLRDTRFEQVAAFDFPKTVKINGITVADLDGDRLPEIYVSANDGTRVSSSIFVLKDGALRPLMTGIDWYLRTVEWPGRGVILMGQRGNDRPEDGYIGRKVSELTVLGNYSRIEETRVLALPENVLLFDFAWVELDGQSGPELVAVDKREKILVYDSKNSLMWVSEEDYGGSRNFFGPPKSAQARTLQAPDDESQFERKMVFLPTRILAVDVDGDGVNEVIIGKNKRLYGKWLSNRREYDGGSVICLGWDGAGLRELWQTKHLNGYIADYDYVQGGSSQSDGEGVSAGLYVAQIPEKMIFGFMMREESKLLMYDLDIQMAE